MGRRVVFVMAMMVAGWSAHEAAQAAASKIYASIDWDANGTSDATILRTSEGRLYVLQGGGTAPFTTAFAIDSASGTKTSDVMVPGLDYNGDGKIDFGLYRPLTLGPAAPGGTWTFTLGPTYTSATSVLWGGSLNDVPIPGDWDGNGVVDVAIWRPSDRKVYVLQGPAWNSAFTIGPWGSPGDVAIPGDYDNDTRLDLAFFNAGDRAVYVLQGGTNFTTAFKIVMGAPGQTPVQGDFDGDGALDLAMVVPGSAGVGGNTWIIAQGGNKFNTSFAKNWGIAGDTLVPGDYDGDGFLDIAVWRPGEKRVFVLQQGATNKYSTAFALPTWGGATGDVPIGQTNYGQASLRTLPSP